MLDTKQSVNTVQFYTCQNQKKRLSNKKRIFQEWNLKFNTLQYSLLSHTVELQHLINL